jgi:multicomponent Na+:H+ antiporter subunit D
MNTEALLSNVPLLVVSVSAVAAGLILLLNRPGLSARRRNVRDLVGVVAALGKFALVLTMLPPVLAGGVVESAPLYIAKDIAFYFRVDAFGLLFALLSSSLWVIVSVYSLGYMRSLRYGHEAGFYAAFALSLSAAAGIAMAGNLLTFFVFFEILTIATYPLIVHRRNKEAVYGGREYMVYLLIAGQLLLIAVAWTHFLAPGVGFTPGGFLAETGASTLALQVLFVLFILGVGVKAAIIPLHGWLPTAMVAPTPVSALLHAVAVVKAGAFGVVRVTGFVFGPELLWALGAGLILACFAAVTIIFASLKALSENHLKRRIAYSTVSQLSYIVLGAALASPAALVGAMFHIVAHGYMKITLFMCAGAIYATAHKEYVSQLDGIGRKMPYTMGAFAVAALAITGMPFFAGFVSKWNLGVGAVEAGLPIFIAVLIGSAVLNVGYFFPVVFQAYFGRCLEPETHAVAAAAEPAVPAAATAHHNHPGGHAGQEGHEDQGEARPLMLYPLLVTAAAAFLFGVVPNFGMHFLELAEIAAREVTQGGLWSVGGGVSR